MRVCERASGAGSGTVGARAALPGSIVRRDRGFVTAETAVVLPVLVVFAMALVWGLLVMAAQIQCVDAARTGARAAARQDPDDAVLAVAREAAPSGARVVVGREADLVRVVVVAEPPVLHGLPFEVRAEAVASAEQTVGTAQPVGEEQVQGEDQVAGGEQVAGSVAGVDS